ncbi:MAG: glycosyltransferase [Labilithrix sp.]|nr:glycosyltransferase [Labilithrix sp.]
MRVIEVVLSLGIGGQERLVARIARALHERGHEMHVVSLTPGGALREELGGVSVHDVPKRDGFDRTLHARLWRLFRRLRPDVVHTHNAAPLVYAAPAARAALVRPVVHTKHGDFRYPSATLRLARAASRTVTHFVAVSSETAAAAERTERPPRARLSVIENGIPLDAFGPDAEVRAAVRRELGLPDDALVVGSVGRLVPDKDYPLLVRAMTGLLSERVRLVLVGDGQARPEIEAAIDASVRPFVLFAGARQDVPRLLSAFDVFASSSRTEGLPLAIPEAMTSRLPIVATAVGGVPSIVPESAGILVAHDDPGALREALRGLIDDRATRETMGARGRSYALERFGEEKMLTQYLALYGA